MIRYDLVSLSLILLSALIHPIWNMILKRSDEKVIFYFNVHLVFFVLFCPVLFIYPVASVTRTGWSLVIFSSVAHFFYQMYLCRTYELGDMSLTYPIIRSAPLFVVIMGVIFLRERLSVMAVLSIIIIVIGAQVINHKAISLKEFSRSWKHADFRVITVALLTAFFSALYSIVDKKGVVEMHPILFFYLLFAISGLMFGVYLLFKTGIKFNYISFTKKNMYKITLAALMEFASYILILYAFRLTEVSVVVAIRQISVVFGALFGVLILKEKYGKVRIFASLIIFTGIFMLVIFK